MNPSRSYNGPEPWELVTAFFPVTCQITHETIPFFTKAWRKKRYYGDGTDSSVWWMSEKGYTFAKLAGLLV